MVKQIIDQAFIILSLIFMVACNPTEKGREQNKSIAGKQLEVDYAKGFAITYHEGYKKIVVRNPWKGANQSFTYLLLDENSEVPDTDHDALVRIPLKTIACTSTSHLPMLEMIGMGDRLTGFPNTRLISSEYFVGQVEKGQLVDLGPDQNMNMERLLDLEPEMLMTYSTGSEVDHFDLLSRSGIPYVLNGDYMESTPLGRAEWIKFMAAFFNREDEADSIFNKIASDYNSLKNLAEEVENKPSVLTGILYGDTWFLPGGKNYSAQFFQDAGARYLWEESGDDGWLELNYESVLDKAQDADYWLGVASFNSRAEMVAADHRYGTMDALDNSKVYNYNAKLGPNGGNAYLELGYSRPDLVLSDLIKILHPEILPDHQMVFYKQLP